MHPINQKNNIKFTSRPIHYANLKKIGARASEKFEKVIISELEKHDISEIDKIIFHLKQKEATPGENRVGNYFCEEFCAKSADNINFNAIELINDKSLSKKILGAVSFFKNFENKIELTYLFTMPQVRSTNVKRKLKGVGEIALGRVFEYAKRTGASEIYINSANDDFYLGVLNKLGIKPIYQQQFQLLRIKAKDFNTYLDYIKKEYHTDFIEKLNNNKFYLTA